MARRRSVGEAYIKRRRGAPRAGSEGAASRVRRYGVFGDVFVDVFPKCLLSLSASGAWVPASLQGRRKWAVESASMGGQFGVGGFLGVCDAGLLGVGVVGVAFESWEAATVATCVEV